MRRDAHTVRGSVPHCERGLRERGLRRLGRVHGLHHCGLRTPQQRWAMDSRRKAGTAALLLGPNRRSHCTASPPPCAAPPEGTAQHCRCPGCPPAPPRCAARRRVHVPTGPGHGRAAALLLGAWRMAASGGLAVHSKFAQPPARGSSAMLVRPHSRASPRTEILRAQGAEPGSGVAGGMRQHQQQHHAAVQRHGTSQLPLKRCLDALQPLQGPGLPPGSLTAPW